MRFHFDQRRGRVHQQMRGFLSVADAEGIHRRVADACDRVRAGGGSLSVLVDMSDYPPQSQEVGAVGGRIAAAYAAVPLSGFAVVTGSALQRVRLRRVLEPVGPAFFDRVDDAAAHLGWERDWLRAISPPDAPPGAASPPAARR